MIMGHVISEVYFYRRGEEIEVSWNNKNRNCKKIKHVNLLGKEKIEKNII
jgi:hypothetical protein